MKHYDPIADAARRGDRIANEPEPICVLCNRPIDALEDMETNRYGHPYHTDPEDCPSLLLEAD